MIVNKIFSFKNLLILLLCFIAGFLAFFLSATAYNFAWSTGILLLIIGLYPFFRAFKKRQIDFLEPSVLFASYFILEMAIKGFQDLLTGSFSRSGLYNTSSDFFYYLMSKVFLYSSLALVFFYIGYYSRFSSFLSSSLPKFPKTYWRRHQLAVAVILSFVLGALAIFVTVKSGLALGAAEFWTYPVGTLPWVGFILLFFYHFDKKRYILCFFLIFLILLFSFFLFFFLRAGKTVVFEAGILILTSYNYLIRRISVKKALVFFLLALLLTPLLVGYKMNENWGKAKEYFVFSITHPSEIFKPVLERSYGADSFALILDNRSDYKFGSSFSELLWFYIPKSLWPGKPQNFPFIFNEMYKTLGPFSIPSLAGELYLNFSWVGIIIGFLLTGAMFRIIYEYLIVNKKETVTILLYAIILPSIILFPQGAIAEALSRIFIKFFITFVVIFSLMVNFFPRKTGLLKNFLTSV